MHANANIQCYFNITIQGSDKTSIQVQREYVPEWLSNDNVAHLYDQRQAYAV